MCHICEHTVCICLPGRPTMNIVSIYISKLNTIIDNYSLNLPEDEIKHIVNLRSKLLEWQDENNVKDFHRVIIDSTRMFYKYTC